MPRRAVRLVSSAPARISASDRCMANVDGRLTRCLIIHAVPLAVRMAQSSVNHHAPYMVDETNVVPLYFSVIVAAAITAMMTIYEAKSVFLVIVFVVWYFLR